MRNEVVQVYHCYPLRGRGRPVELHEKQFAECAPRRRWRSPRSRVTGAAVMKQRARKKLAAAWLMRERLVAFLEKAIAPGSEVRHNVRLPVLTSPSKRRRQCDVVICAGQKPRQTLAIVEVQKRGRKVDIGHFHAWIAKMQQVGANQLICVSESGFPESIIEEAQQHGSRVKLITFGDAAAARTQPPVVMMPVAQRQSGTFEVTDVTDLRIVRPRGPAERLSFNTAATIFSLQGSERRISLNELVALLLANSNDVLPPPHEPLPPEIEFQFDLGSIGTPLLLHDSDHATLVRRCIVRGKLFPKRDIIPMEMTNVPYAEHGTELPLVWASTGNMSEQDGSEIRLVTAVRIVDGQPSLSLTAYRDSASDSPDTGGNIEQPKA